MTHFGKIATFNIAAGTGTIQPEAGGKVLPFERSALNWPRTDPPAADQRLSYEDGKDPQGKACAVKLQPA